MVPVKGIAGFSERRGSTATTWSSTSSGVHPESRIISPKVVGDAVSLSNGIKQFKSRRKNTFTSSYFTLGKDQSLPLIIRNISVNFTPVFVVPVYEHLVMNLSVSCFNAT